MEFSDMDTPLHRAILNIVATSINARVWADKDYIDFGNCLVNTIEERFVTVLNPYDCDVHAEFYPVAGHSNDTGFLMI